MSKKSISSSLPEKMEYFQKNSLQRNHSELIQVEIPLEDHSNKVIENDIDQISKTHFLFLKEMK